MKNIFVALAFLSLLLFGCSKKESDDKKPITTAKMDSTGALMTTKDDAPPKDIVLSYDLKKDQHLSYKITQIQMRTQSLQTETKVSQNIKQTTNYVVDMDVKEIDEDKNMDIRASVKSINMDMEANGQKVSYQSGLLKDQSERLKFVEYESLLNNPYSFRMAPNGEILEVYRVDKIVDKYLDIRGIKDSVSIQDKRQLQQEMAENVLKPLLQQIFQALPKNQIAVDSTWQNSYPGNIPPFQVENINKYKLKGFEKLNDDRLAVINASFELRSKGKNKITERGVDFNFKNPEAERTGTIYFNVVKGYIQSIKTSSKVKMNYTMRAPKATQGPKKAESSDIIEKTSIVELL